MRKKYRKKQEQRGLRVDVRNNNVEWGLKKLKRKVKESGMILELKRRTYYEKPSEKRVRKGKEMAAAWKKKERLRKLKEGF